MNCQSISRLCYFSQATCKHHLPLVLQCSSNIQVKCSRKIHMEAPKGDPIDAYLKTKQKYESKKLPPNVNPRGVFACNELDLEEVNVYGFDYDYTLAVYKPSMDFLLYNLARETLISKYKYPRGIMELEYKPGFAIRGLHYDIEKGLLMKIDSFLQIQLGTVYRGLSPVTDDEVLRLYKNRIIPLAYVETHGKNAQYVTSKMVQLADMFSVPEMCLLCNITEYFIQNGIDFHPEILFRDVKNSVGSSHPVMHKLLQEDVSQYIEKNPGITYFFQRLADAGKKLFLVTNSPYKFVNKGMSWMVGDNWEDFFDVIIVQARKPLFFTDESRPLRIYDKENDSYLWDKVTELKKGVIYFEGTINQLKDMTGWYGSEVLYFGDHPYSDLADVTLEHGWRTGAIINELVHEIETLNDEHFKRTCNWLQMLTQLIEDWQDSGDPRAVEANHQWEMERDQLRQSMKCVFNKQFGSVFRTYHNPTYFSRRLFRFADIYTSHITNLLQYSVNHTFYPRRGVMPHEYISYFV
ncbi:5'-nucleotidase domain-containing protein 3-like isoform X2 [Macrosteles quadrilineatus]|uniref:5'-nucleotidase domain-containing protein 3-like isoform X2 n=2 Tax=Macrosteles quadrilineatus TaxID=74068 RepID=UPI0023E32664|nr:5'-nucleotidase domain-containing protein 3-like isoform X2 [Macrosteles quadrilineatus]